MQQSPGNTQKEHWFRQLTPLVLLAIGFVILFEPGAERMVVGHDWLRDHLGEHWLLRLCCAVLVFYVLLLWGECIRLQSGIASLLKSFREALGQARGEPGKTTGVDRLDAMRLLAAAMHSGDESIRAKCRVNLTRLAGTDLGEDPVAWSAWIEQQGKEQQGKTAP